MKKKEAKPLKKLIIFVSFMYQFGYFVLYKRIQVSLFFGHWSYLYENKNPQMN